MFEGQNVDSLKRGAIWRKTDLHIHTPASNWGSDYDYDELITNLKNSEAEIIGINDYATIEGYKKIIEKGGIKDKIILPVIEMRMSNEIKYKGKAVVKSGTNINFHIIFDNTIPIETLNIELNSLECLYEQGERSKLGHIEKADLGKVMFDFFKVLKNLEDSKLKDKFLVWLPYDEYGGIDKIDPENDSYFKMGLIKNANIIGSSNKTQIEFFLSERFKEKFVYGKPCIKGSDAHTVDYPFGKLKNDKSEPIEKYCWIKSDNTFEGLKQVIFEPDTRVKIQQEKPDEKKPYNIIKSVRFKGHSKFSDEWIHLNQNLNSIIGGKSSGKSLLLYYIAKTIIPERIENIKKEFEGIKKYLGYNFEGEKHENFDFEVQWEDGEIYSLKNTEKRNKICTYIPQMYLNHIAENEESKKELNKIIEEILKTDSEFREKYNKKNESILEEKNKLVINLEKYFSEEVKYTELKNELKNLGDEEAIKKSIVSYESIVKNLEKESKLTEEEIIKYQKISSFEKKQNEKIASLNEKINKTKEISETTEKLFKDELKEFIYEKYRKYTSNYISDEKILMEIIKIKDSVEKLSSSILEDTKNRIEKQMSFINRQIEKRKDFLKNIKQRLIPLSDKMSNAKIIEKQLNELKSEGLKLKNIKDKKEEINIKKTEVDESKSKIIESYCKIFKTYEELMGISKERKDITKDISLVPEIKFKDNEFIVNFIEKIKKTNTLETQFGNYFDKNEFIFCVKNHCNNIEDIFNKMTQEESVIQLNKNINKSVVIKSLFDNYFYLDYDLMQDEDRLLDMSPGKRGIILFQLFLHLSASETPILVDQPEDNLDNRTVYKELNQFIKQQKTKRQIIMVSHNANLVVSTDSENVIVANQMGQNGNKENKEHRFEYINGALENTKEVPEEKGILYQKGIKEHVCEILEGGVEAFKVREKKYNIK